MSHRVWTTGRKIWGNIAPLIPAIPLIAVGAWRGSQIQNYLHWTALIWFAAAVVAAWFAIGLFGLVGNQQMRMALFRRFASDEESAKAKQWFVGIATPTYKSVWDPHEDIGFLSWTNSSLLFQGDGKKIEVLRDSVKRVRRAPNIHSWLMLGGWVLVEGQIDGKPIQLMIEPRDKNTLWGNRRLLNSLREELDKWRATRV